MKKQVFVDEIDIFDKVIERYNPKHEKLTQDIYVACQEKFLNDEEYDSSDFHKYMFFSVCEGLKKYYIENDLKPQGFEDDISSAYLMVLRHEPDQKFKTSKQKYEFVLRDVIRKLEKEKYESRCANAYLNYDYDPNTSQIEASDREDVLAKMRREAILKEISVLGPTEQKVILEHFGLNGEEKNFRQLAEENNKSVDEVKSNFDNGIRHLRKNVCSKNFKEFAL